MHGIRCFVENTTIILAYGGIGLTCRQEGLPSADASKVAVVEVPAQVAEGELLEAVFEAEALVRRVGVECPVDAGNALGHDGGMSSLVTRKAGGP